MPWRQKTMKDVASCEKPSVDEHQAFAGDTPNGETQRDELTLRQAEYIGWYKSTQGSEPSQYLVENKSNRDSESSGERNRKSPNRCVYTAGL